MAAATDDTANKEQRRKELMLGDLPSDFLRIAPTTLQQQIAADEQAALALHQQMSEGSFVPANVTGRLSISITEARLTKNYGVTRMDPYVKLRIGHTVYETHTDYNGAKNPRWNKVFHCFVPAGVNTIHLEVYDECAFTLDEKIAWAQCLIPESVFKGETADLWVPLNGRQGDEREGQLNLVLSYVAVPVGRVVYPPPPMMVVSTPYYGIVPGAVPYYTAATPVPAVYGGAPPTGQQPPPPPPPPPQQPVQISDSDVKQVSEMFPNIENDVVKTIMEMHRGNKDQTINALLAMSNES